jgi:uncharacterized coiled-coil protein SlyX
MGNDRWTAQLQEKLAGSQQPDRFWEEMINFIELNLKQYAIKLKEKGVDPSIFASFTKQGSEESTKEKLNHIKGLLVSLAKFDQALGNRENFELEDKVKNLEMKLAEQNQILKEQQDLLVRNHEEFEKQKSQFMTIKQESDRKLLLQPKQVKTKMNEELKLVRDRINMIHEMTMQVSEDSVGNLQTRVNDAIKTIVDQLANQELWPKEEKKPEFTIIKKEKAVSKRSKKKKMDEETIEPDNQPVVEDEEKKGPQLKNQAQEQTINEDADERIVGQVTNVSEEQMDQAPTDPKEDLEIAQMVLFDDLENNEGSKQ